MSAPRSFLASPCAVWLCVATLLLKLLVPTGYMIENDHGRVAITICSGIASPGMEMPAMQGMMPDHDKSKDHGKAEMPCAFAGLSAAALGAIDPILLVALIAFIMAIALGGSAVPAPLKHPFLRPPLRGPPAHP